MTTPRSAAPQDWPTTWRYTTPDEAPRGDPPPEMGVTRENGLTMWRIGARWWHTHQPDPVTGVLCGDCHIYWPCLGFRSALTILNRFHYRHEQTAGRRAKET